MTNQTGLVVDWMNGLVNSRKQKTPMYVGGSIGLVLLVGGAVWWLLPRDDLRAKADANRIHQAVINLFLQSEYDTSFVGLQPRQIRLFNSVHQLQNKLVAAGTGTIRKWRTDHDGWIYTTDFQDFGEQGSNGLPNNLTFCLESPSPDYIETLRVEVNINNSHEREEALQTYTQTVEKIMGAIGISMPENIKKALRSGTQLDVATIRYVLKNSRVTGAIESWQFAVISR
ncbi:hypothetical protein WBJ53_08775 [Spirosoma sp. SC4-14]|uniref:hypothetical protein n=1 Tax=Spirosoma sp. SC4-14 TaxID=3128900 RepID=UPI0030D02BC7